MVGLVLNRLPMRGTLLNTVTAAAGALIGLGVGSALPPGIAEAAIMGIGLIVLAFGIKMALESKNMLVMIVAVVLGVVIGTLVGIDGGVAWVAEEVRKLAGESGSFNEGLIAASVLFCVGPLTLMGCLEDGLGEGFDMLKLKSALDFISAIILAATLGIGVLFAAVVVLFVQGALTLAATKLRRISENPDLLAEATGAGGVIMLALGLSILGIKDIPTENFLPALLIAPVLAVILAKRKSKPAQVT
jgi:uncharacterized membrane protein YqgA involved in biofilm formation